MDRADDAPPAATAVGPGAPARLARRKLVRLALVALVVAGIAIGGFLYWRHSLHYATTDNAYVERQPHRDRGAGSGPGRPPCTCTTSRRSTRADVLFDIDPAPYGGAR